MYGNPGVSKTHPLCGKDKARHSRLFFGLGYAEHLYTQATLTPDVRSSIQVGKEGVAVHRAKRIKECDIKGV